MWHNSSNIDGLAQERRNSSVLAMELCLLNTNPKIWELNQIQELDDSMKTPTSLVTLVPGRHIVVVLHIRVSYRLLSLLFHDNRASYSCDTIWPWKFKVKDQGQKSRSRYPSQQNIQLTYVLFVSYQLDKPCLRYGKENVSTRDNELEILPKK